MDIKSVYQNVIPNVNYKSTSSNQRDYLNEYIRNTAENRRHIYSSTVL